MMTRVPCRYHDGPLVRTPAELDIKNLASEDVCHVSSSRVVLAEYDVLQHDFPELRTEELILLNPELRDLSPIQQAAATHSIIDEWLIANAAFVSCKQAAQAIVNSPIQVDTRQTIAYRPHTYGRAVIIPLQDVWRGTTRRPRWRMSQGLLDLKGAGVAPDAPLDEGTSRNGLSCLGETLADFLVKKVVDEILARELPTVWSVPVYALLDLGFDVVGGIHGDGPAGMHVRRAHRRRQTAVASSAEHKTTFEIEAVLRRYGMTTAPRVLQLHIRRAEGEVTWQRGRDAPVRITDPQKIGVSLGALRDADAVTLDRRDVQMIREVDWPPAQAQILDFGAFRIEPRFDVPTVGDLEGSPVDEILWPTDARFVQPDPKLQLPIAVWQRYTLRDECFAWAEEFRRRELSPEAMRRRVDDRIRALTDMWSDALDQSPAVPMMRADVHAQT